MSDLAQKIREGTRALCPRRDGHRESRPAALSTLCANCSRAGHARIVGITGPPGAGKSTLVDALAAALRQQGKTVGDHRRRSQQPLTGGAILGDRIRMQQHHADPGIFIRSMATRGLTGGLARATADMVRLIDAAGKDYVLIETVGVGQDEVEIAGLAQVDASWCWCPAWATTCRRSRPASWRSPISSWSTKPTSPGADRIERELHAEGWDAPVSAPSRPTGQGSRSCWQAIRSTSAALGLAAGALGPSRIDHLGIAVKRSDAAMAFYEALGMPSAIARLWTEKVHVAMLPAGDSRIELLEPSAPDSPIAKFIEKRGEGLHHVALKVPDLDAAVDRLEPPARGC